MAMNAPFVPPETAQRYRVTAKDYWLLADAGAFVDYAKTELIEGEIERMPPPGNAHSARQLDLLAGLLAILPKALIRPEVAIDLGDDTVLGCDAAVLRQPVSGAGALTPDQIALVVEVAVSTRERDLSYKRRRYSAAGIPTYWMVDEERGVVHVFDRPQEADYLGIDLVRFGAPLAVPGSGETITLN